MMSRHGARCNCDCQELDGRLAALLDEELSAAECAALRAELAACPQCAASLAAEETVRALLRACCGSGRAPEGLRERVTYQLRVTSVRSVRRG